MKISIIGVGYVGLVTAVCLAAKGHTVVCVDCDKNKIANILSNKSPSIHEDGLESLMKTYWERLIFTTDIAKALSSEIIFIAVGTPERKDGSANLQYIWQVVRQISEQIKTDAIIAVKSTVPVGTNDKIAHYFAENCKYNLEVVSNPEFLSQGTAVRDTFQASRIIVGAPNKYIADKVLEVYRDFDVPKIVTDRCTAEMIKYASNDFLALKISYINEIANLCEEVGANIEDVAKGMGYDKRIGKDFLKAGIGYGGSCFPKDTRALHWLSNFHDHEIKTIKAAIEVNESQKIRLIKKARKYCATFEGVRVAVLGLAFKAGTDDLRDAPSIANVNILLEEGAKVKVYDPVANENFKNIFGESVTYCRTIDEAIEGANLCFICTEWPEVVSYDIKKYAELMKNPIVLDGRNCYEKKIFNDTSIIYESIGR